MKVTGLKVLQIKEWKNKSSFTADDGRVFEVPANQKFVCRDGDDFVNLTVKTDSPIPNVKVGDVLTIDLLGFSRSSFSINVKGTIA